MDCTICDYEAGSVEDLRRHKKLMHSSFATITINGKYKIEVKRIGGILTCPVCGVADEDSQTFRNHARQLHSNADDYFKKNPTRHASQNRNRTPYRRPGKTNVWCLASMPCSLFMCSFIDIFKWWYGLDPGTTICKVLASCVRMPHLSHKSHRNQKSEKQTRQVPLELY